MGAGAGRLWRNLKRPSYFLERQVKVEAENDHESVVVRETVEGAADLITNNHLVLKRL